MAPVQGIIIGQCLITLLKPYLIIFIIEYNSIVLFGDGKGELGQLLVADIVLVCSFIGGNVHQTGFRYQQIRNRLFDFRYLVTVDNSVLRINTINATIFISQP